MNLFLSALKQENNTSRIPLWFMRQVGRYLPEYQKLKNNRSLFELFHNEEFVIKSTLLAPDLLHVDAAILFSDILIILDAFHVSYDFLEKKGPVVIFNPLEKLQKKSGKKIFQVQINAIKALKKELSIPLIGFAGSPFTIASYLLEQSSCKNFYETRKFMYAETEKFQNLLNDITDITIEYLEMQIHAGIDAIQLFDSSAYVLPKYLFSKYCIEINKKIISRLKKFFIPIILYSGDSSYRISSLLLTEADCLSLDWHRDLHDILPSFPKNRSLQGNMDPLMLFSDDNNIKQYLDSFLPLCKNHPGYIFNLGHGIHPQTSVEKLKSVIDYVRSGS